MRITGITRPARRGIASLLIGLVTGAPLLGTAPTASGAEPSAESQDQPPMKCVEQAPYFFHGESGQQGGFSTDAPPNTTPAAQLTYWWYPAVETPSAASWADSFQGDLCGQATVTVYIAPVRQRVVSLSSNWDIWVIADDNDTIATERFWIDGVTPQEATVSFRLKATVAENLEFWFSPRGLGGAAFLYDSPEFAAGFTVSTLQPCEENDPHADCVEAGFEDLAGDVRAFADTGEVSADGKTQLLAVLEAAETAYDHGDNAQAVSGLEHFRQLAGDPALVPSDPARDTLTTTASELMAALQDSEPA